MKYPDIELNVKRPMAVELRKAVQPLTEQFIKLEDVDKIVKAQTANVRDELKAELSELIKAVVSFDANIPAKPDLSTVAKKSDLLPLATQFETLMAKQLETTKVLKSLNDASQQKIVAGMQQIYNKVNQVEPPATDPAKPTDYINVRLTDGDNFYKALDQFVTAIGDNVSPFSDSTTGKPSRPTVTNGALNVNAQISATISGAQQYTDGATSPAHAIGDALVFDNGGTMASVSATHPLPIAGTFSATASTANNTFGSVTSITDGSSTTVVNVASSPAGMKLRGFSATGTGDGYFYLQYAGSTILSGRITINQKSIVISLPDAVSCSTGTAIALKVTNESGSTANYEATLLAE